MMISVLQDGIMTARAETQREIQLAAHDILESLVQGLIQAQKTNMANQGIFNNLNFIAQINPAKS